MVRPRVFLDVAADTQPIGRLIFELYNDSAPITAENFRALCTGEKGLSPVSQQPLYYKNSIIHRSIKDFMIQGGDFTKRNGTGGESIYGGPFADEDLSLPLDSTGLLVMANKGPNTNNSQFFITLRECPHLNGKHVVFGRVIRGYDEIVPKIAQVPTDEKDRPSIPIVITNCGELELRRPPKATVPEHNKAASEASDSGERSRKRRHQSRSASRSRSRSRSHSPASDYEGESRKPRRKKESKKKHERKKDKAKRHGSRSASEAPDEVSNEPHQETEEEYDARLEREEKDRLEMARLQELEVLKAKYAETKTSANGIRFKGRGRMKFLDPEMRMPT